MHRLGLGLGGPRQHVMDRRGLSLSQCLLHNHVNHRPVLGVHADERAVLRRLAQRFEDGAVIDHEHVGIGHEQLEAGHTLAHHLVHVFETGVRQVGHNHVQPIVDAGLALGLLPPGVERRAHLRPARLDGEVHNRGRSADGRCPRARLKIVRRRSPAEGHVEMRMRVDPARQHKQPRGIHHFVRRARRNAGAHFLDHRAVDQQIRLRAAVGIHNRSVLNQNLGHNLSSSLSTSSLTC